MSESLQKPDATFASSLAATADLVKRLKSISVMVVDDHCYMRTLVVRMLREIGIQTVHVASGGDEALALVEKGEPPVDLILCDLKMPGQDGFAFVAALRRLPDAKKAHLPILIMTGNATADSIDTLSTLGVQGVIVKPLATNVLREHIFAALLAPIKSEKDALALLGC